MKIRKATYDDVETLNHLLTLLIRDERQYNSAINENFTVINMYENYIEDLSRLIIVAEKEGKIAGYLYGYLLPTDDSYKYKVSKLDALYVNSEYRQSGVATALIQYFKEWSKSNHVKSIEVGVCSNNQKAKNLYTKQNFETQMETMITYLD